jgi:hypothetical protein
MGFNAGVRGSGGAKFLSQLDLQQFLLFQVLLPYGLLCWGLHVSTTFMDKLLKIKNLEIFIILVNCFYLTIACKHYVYIVLSC